MAAPQEITFQFKKTKLITLVLWVTVALLVLVGCAWFSGFMAFVAFAEGILLAAVPLAIMFLALCAGGVLVVLALYGVLRGIFSTEPRLILNRDGFYDNAPLGSIGFIPWSEVVEIGKWNSSLAVVLKEPEKYISTSKGLKKFALKLNLRAAGLIIYMDPRSLGLKFEELAELFQEYQAYYMEIYSNEGSHSDP